MLLGEFTSKLTDKNRTALPKKFREEIGNKIIIAKGYEGCLILVTKEQWMKIVKNMVIGPYTKEAVRDTSRFIMGSASEVTTDKQGRFVLPGTLKDYSGINKDIMFIGLMNRVEVWAMSKWQEKSNYLAKNSSLIAEKLESISD